MIMYKHVYVLNVKNNTTFCMAMAKKNKNKNKKKNKQRKVKKKPNNLAK